MYLVSIAERPVYPVLSLGEVRYVLFNSSSHGPVVNDSHRQEGSGRYTPFYDNDLLP